MAVSFQSDHGFALKAAGKHRDWISGIIKWLKKKEGRIGFHFTSDKELTLLNEKYLNHRTLTDILTFDYSERSTLHGDILISVDRVRENAAEFKTGFEGELRRVMAHGVLHLAGYRDKTEKELAEMRRMEERAMKRFLGRGRGKVEVKVKDKD
jgi:probable rRNA maturation factor